MSVGTAIVTAGHRPRPRSSRALTVVVGLIAPAIAVAIGQRVASPSLLGVVAAAVGVAVVVYLFVTPRVEVGLVVFGAYLGLVDGYLKLKTNNDLASTGRDVFLYATVAGVCARAVIRRGPIRLPPLTGWVVAFALIVVLQVFNPETLSPTKALGGLRQHLEFVPLFFLAATTLTTKESLRGLLVLLVVVAGINGVVGTVQSGLSPDQLSGWGPGYKEKIDGTGDVAGRVFTDDDGEVRIRPFGLGPDFGFAGSVGVIALPGIMALFSMQGVARRLWWLAPLAVATGVGIITSQSRSAILSAVLTILVFAGYSVVSRRALRLVGTMVVAGLLAIVVLPPLLGSSGAVFDRYESIAPDRVFKTTFDYRSDDNGQILDIISRYPLGAGLATVGPARAFGGAAGKSVNGETEFNFLQIELGLPGMLLFLAFWFKLIALSVSRMRRIVDQDVRLMMAAFATPFVTLLLAGFGGPATSAPPWGPLFWLFAGILAYWLVQGPSSVRVPAAGRGSVPELVLAAHRPGAQPAVTASAAVAPRPVPNNATSMRLAVLICTRNRASDLVSALESIRASSVPVHEVIVADDSTDGATREAVAAYPEARYVSGPRTGLGANRNVALDQVTGSHVLFIDDDVLLTHDFVAAVERAWHATSPGLRGRRVFVGAERQAGLLVTPNEQDRWGFQSRPYRPGEPLRTVVINAAVFPAGLFDLVRFDPHLVYGYDEVDVTTQAVAAGYELVRVDDAVNEHCPSPRGREDYAAHTNASRLYVTYKRKRWTEGHRLQAAVYLRSAEVHLLVSGLRRRGLVGARDARSAKRMARRMIGLHRTAE